MKVLVACEESQRVCTAFRNLGHWAFSCDILPCSGGHEEWHIKQDVTPLLNGDCYFHTMDGKPHLVDGAWDIIIAHPPCTDLAVSGARHFYEKIMDGRQQKSIDFFMQFTKTNCKHVCIENPISIMSTRYHKPDQYIQPYQFGHPISKKTCLWLKGLPKLVPTNIVEPNPTDEHGFSINGALRYARDENGKILSWKDPRTAIERSKTFPGIAQAMAEQWSVIEISDN